MHTARIPIPRIALGSFLFALRQATPFDSTKVVFVFFFLCVFFRSTTSPTKMPSRAKLRPLAAPLSSLLGAPAPTAPAVPAARNRNSNSTNTNIVPRLAGAGRAYSSRNAGGEEAPASSAPEPPSRWYSDLHARLGKCLMFGCTPAQVATASSVLGALAAEWRPLVAGSQGYLTGGRRGLEDQQVVWGEQDSFVRDLKEKDKRLRRRSREKMNIASCYCCYYYY